MFLGVIKTKKQKQNKTKQKQKNKKQKTLMNNFVVLYRQ